MVPPLLGERDGVRASNDREKSEFKWLHRAGEDGPREACAPLRNQSRAFTLIELMVVVAILAIVLTMAFPAIRGAVNRAPLTQGVMDIVNGCEEARRQAILGNQPMALRFYGDGRIEVAEAPHEAQPADASPSAPLNNPVILDPTAPPKPAFTKFTAQLPDSIGIELFEINLTDYRNTEMGQVQFQPNGTSDELTMVLTSPSSGERRIITLDPLTAIADFKPL